ncbi:hypothetical protein PJP07_13080 [Mycobacterium kansasii]
MSGPSDRYEQPRPGDLSRRRPRLAEQPRVSAIAGVAAGAEQLPVAAAA